MSFETINVEKEILRVGKWNGENITSEDIDEMITNFEELKGNKEVAMRVGHRSDDKPNTKILRAGTIDRLEKRGDRLVAFVRNMPKIVYEAIKAEMLKPVSVEFYRKWKDEAGKIRRNVLDAVAIMGVSKPAVSGLADFGISFTEELNDEQELIKIEFVEEIENTKQEDDIVENQKDNSVELAELQAEKERISVELQSKESERASILAEKERLENELNEFKAGVEENKITAFVESLSTQDNMKVLPAEKERITRILKAVDNELISFEAGDEKLNARQELEAFLSGLPNRVEFSVASDKGEVDKPISFENEEEKRDYIATKAVELAANNGTKVSIEQDKLLKELEG